MRDQVQAKPARPPLARRVLAGLVLAAVAALGLYIVIGVIKAIAWTALVVVAVIAVAWALKTLVW